MQYAEVMVDVPAARRAFHYSIPPALLPHLARGSFVRVPFRNKVVDGIVVDVAARLPGGLVANKLRPIHRIVVASSQLPTGLLRLASWMSEQYFCSLADALFTMLPPFPQKRQLDLKVSERPRTQPGKQYFVNGREERRWATYVKTVQQSISHGKSALIIFPTMERAERFTRSLHSHHLNSFLYSANLPRAHRFRTWERIARGDFDCIVGTRLAVFSPLPHIDLIIVDDESHPGHVDDQQPRYRAPVVAEARVRLEGGTLVTGGEIPSIAVFDGIEKGWIRSIDRPAPETPTTLTDLQSRHPILAATIEEALGKYGRGVIVTTRLGAGGATRCQDCGHLFSCPNCELPLTLHERGELRCHHCGHREALPSSCPDCRGNNIRPVGVGAERLEEYLLGRFPGQRIGRLQADRRPETRWDILVATVKVLDTDLSAPIVAVHSLDSILELPDPFAVERAAQLLVQLRSRATEHFFVQTRLPDHRVFRVLTQPDEFLKQELSLRVSKRYPPAVTLVRLLLAGSDRVKIATRLTNVASKLKETLNPAAATVLGPGPAFYEKLKGQYRWHLLVKLLSDDRKVREQLKSLIPDDIQITVNPNDSL